MSNWFVGAFFVALAIIGIFGVFAAVAGQWELTPLALGLVPALWYSKRYESPSMRR